MKWKKLNSRIAFENRWLKVIVDRVIRPDGREGEYSVLETDKVVLVVPIDEDRNINLIRQFRYPVQKDSWEVIKGRADGEEPLIAAVRELKEETGFSAEEWERIGLTHPLNGLAREDNITFLAKKLKQTNLNQQKEEGIEKLAAYSWSKVEEMIAKGQITDGQSITALYKVKLYLEKK